MECDAPCAPPVLVCLVLFFAANKQPICPQEAVKELFDMEDEAGEKAADLLTYNRALKEFRDYSLAGLQCFYYKVFIVNNLAHRADVGN